MLGQQGAAVGQRILFRRAGQLVDEALHDEGGVRMSTERHHSTVTGLVGECSSTRWSAMASRIGELAAPSTEVASMPS